MTDSNLRPVFKNILDSQLSIHSVSSRLLLHVHNDIEDAAKWYKIPIVLYDENDVYIMQENRCVFVGKPKQAEQFMIRNEGKYCKSRFPL
jgi:hypothetical protein